jgi:hypothetical protein
VSRNGGEGEGVREREESSEEVISCSSAGVRVRIVGTGVSDNDVILSLMSADASSAMRGREGELVAGPDNLRECDTW